MTGFGWKVVLAKRVFVAARSEGAQRTYFTICCSERYEEEGKYEVNELHNG